MSKFKEHIHNFTCVSNSYRKNWSFLLYTCNEIPWFLFLLLVISLDKNSACHIASITINNNLCIPNPIQLAIVCAKYFMHATVKKILNVHIENWFTMELPSKMNSELESNTPPPPEVCEYLLLVKIFWTSLPPLFINDVNWFAHFSTQFLAFAIIYRSIH